MIRLRVSEQFFPITVKLAGPDPRQTFSTLIKPDVAPGGTVAIITELLTTTKAAAGILLKYTSEAPVKFEPEMVTTVPAGPEEGKKDPTETGQGSEAIILKSSTASPSSDPAALESTHRIQNVEPFARLRPVRVWVIKV
jgi:hypothetical protein